MTGGWGGREHGEGRQAQRGSAAGRTPKLWRGQESVAELSFGDRNALGLKADSPA